MGEWIKTNWQFLIGQVLIPILLFIVGLFTGGKIERKKINNKAKVSLSGSNNTIMQNCKFGDESLNDVK